MDFTTLTSFGGCMTPTLQNVSATTDGPRYATAGGGVYAVLHQPPARSWAATTSTVTKTTPVRGTPPGSTRRHDLDGLFYGAVRTDGAAAAYLATFEGGRWLGAERQPLPSGVLLFGSAPAARGWLVAHMGATTRGYTEQGEPLGVTP